MDQPDEKDERDADDFGWWQQHDFWQTC
jgi:hypothetical protein